jgi:hypothetical protein
MKTRRAQKRKKEIQREEERGREGYQDITN